VVASRTCGPCCQRARRRYSPCRAKSSLAAPNYPAWRMHELLWSFTMKRSGSSVPRNSSVPEPMCASYRLSRRREAGPVRACRIPPRAIANGPGGQDPRRRRRNQSSFLPHTADGRLKNGPCLIHPEAAESDGQLSTDHLIGDEHSEVVVEEDQAAHQFPSRPRIPDTPHWDCAQ
jgi:hypothetical protein